jgi:hypothetical protein
MPLVCVWSAYGASEGSAAFAAAAKAEQLTFLTRKEARLQFAGIQSKRFRCKETQSCSKL